MLNKETFISINSFDISRNGEKYQNVSKIDPYLQSNIFTEIEKEKNWNYINISKVINDNSLKLHNVIKKLQNLKTTRNESEIKEKIVPKPKSLENVSEQKFKTIKIPPEKKYFMNINFPMKLEHKSRNRVNEFYTLNSNLNTIKISNHNSSRNSFRNSLEYKKNSETERTIVNRGKNLGKNIFLENKISMPSFNFNHTTKIQIRKSLIDRKIPSLEKENLDRINKHLVLKFNKDVSDKKSSCTTMPSRVPSPSVKPKPNRLVPSSKFHMKKIPRLNFKNLFKESFSRFEKVSTENGCDYNHLHLPQQNLKHKKNAKSKTNADDTNKINAIGKIDLITNTNRSNKYNTINASNRSEENNYRAREYSDENKSNFFMTNVEKFIRKIPKSKFETFSYTNTNEQIKTIQKENFFQRIKRDDLISSHNSRKNIPQISAPTNTYEDFASEVYLKQEVVKLLDSNSDAVFIDAIKSNNESKSKQKNSLSIDQSNIFKKCRNVDLINEKSSVNLRNVLESTYKIDFKKNEVFGFDRSRSKIEPLSDRNSVNKEIREIKNFKLKCMLNNLVNKANCKSKFN